jgi:hypothetical protein
MLIIVVVRHLSEVLTGRCSLTCSNGATRRVCQDDRRNLYTVVSDRLNIVKDVKRTNQIVNFERS